MTVTLLFAKKRMCPDCGVRAGTITDIDGGGPFCHPCSASFIYCADCDDEVSAMGAGWSPEHLHCAGVHVKAGCVCDEPCQAKPCRCHLEGTA